MAYRHLACIDVCDSLARADAALGVRISPLRGDQEGNREVPAATPLHGNRFMRIDSLTFSPAARRIATAAFLSLPIACGDFTGTDDGDDGNPASTTGSVAFWKSFQYQGGVDIMAAVVWTLLPGQLDGGPVTTRTSVFGTAEIQVTLSPRVCIRSERASPTADPSISL